MVKRRTTRRGRVSILSAIGRIAGHKRLRESCKSCPKRGHDHIKKGHKDLGNYHRFHGYGSYCRTHRSSPSARNWCTSSGKSKSLAIRQGYAHSSYKRKR